MAFMKETPNELWQRYTEAVWNYPVYLAYLLLSRKRYFLDWLNEDEKQKHTNWFFKWEFSVIVPKEHPVIGRKITPFVWNLFDLVYLWIIEEMQITFLLWKRVVLQKTTANGDLYSDSFNLSDVITLIYESN